jgi:heme exporter protein C
MYLEWLRPLRVLSASSRFIPILVVLCLFFLVCGLYLSCWVAPSDFQQGENARAIFIHVPAAWMSLLIYGFITLSSLVYLITKHPLVNLLSETGCQIGALFTLLTLCSGCLWGKPMWGTFWVWDARLTSVLILFFIYCAALRFRSISTEVSSIFICCGFINIPIIKFSVNWWNTLHQPSSISQFGTSIHLSMLVPILLMFVCFVCLFLVFFFLETRKRLLRHLLPKVIRK